MRFNVIIVVLATLAFVFLHYIDFFDLLYEESRHYEHLELDELFNLFIVAVPALAIILAARSRRLAREVAMRREAEDEASILANFDPLTGMANRRMFLAEFRNRLSAAADLNKELNLMVIDLDRFKSINDFYGHAAGDELLRTVAARIRRNVRDGDLVARLGGDEFAVLSIRNDKDDALFGILDRLVTAISQPMQFGQYHVGITCSIGAARYPSDGSDEDVLTKHADHALYQAKSAGKNRYAVFDETLADSIAERQALERDLKVALSDGTGEIVPFFQPILELATNRILQFEVLARWNHPQRGLIEAKDFATMAEDIGMADQLYLAMLRGACLAARGWDKAIAISVNLSPAQFADKDLVRKTLHVLSETDFSPERLELEVTETSIVQDFGQAQHVIKGLKAAGIRVALDDFGIGYSGLRHLHNLTLDKIKIDRSFLAPSFSPTDTNIIVSAVIDLGHNLGLTVVAEGIEDTTQASWLSARGCDLGQGYLFSQPLTADDAAIIARDGIACSPLKGL
ncbi:putative bifunctional diguanylate cyclase/phosphodiesterase [Pseudoroseicyclus sp. H15]